LAYFGVWSGLSARESGLKAVKQERTGPFFSNPRSAILKHPPIPSFRSPQPLRPPINGRKVVHGRLLGVLGAGPRMGHNRGPPDAREWHFRALGAIESRSPRHGRPRLQRPLLDATGAGLRASKPAGLSTATPRCAEGTVPKGHRRKPGPLSFRATLVAHSPTGRWSPRSRGTKAAGCWSS